MIDKEKPLNKDVIVPRLFSRPKRRRGVAAVELALLLPPLVVMAFGIVELGWYLDKAQVIHSAVRQGARAAVRLENSNAEVEAAVQNCLYNDAGIDAAAVTVEITCLSAAGQELYQVQNLNENEQGQPVRVTVSVLYSQMGALTNMLGLQAGSLSSFAVVQRRK